MDASTRVGENGQSGLVERYGHLHDEELPESDRADRLANLLVEVFDHAGVAARRARTAAGRGPGVGVVLDGVSYLIEVAWSSNPAGQELIEALGDAAGTRPVRLAMFSMTGYEPGAVRYLQTSPNPGIVLLDRPHIEAILCGLVRPPALLQDAANRALFDNQPYTDLTDLLVGSARPPTPAQFATSDQLPAPWPLQVQAMAGVQVRHLLSGDAGWAEPLGFALANHNRVLLTVGGGIVEVDLKRGTTDWLLPLPGCRGTPLVAGDGSILTLYREGVVRWRDGALTPIGGGFGDARTLLAGPGGEPWVLSGHGATFGSGTGTLALTRLGGTPGRQHRHHIHFDADVQTAGWLADLRFFLAAGSNSAVIDLARSTGVRREDWIETFHHSPGHVVVVDPQTVITASPSSSGVRATLYRTDVTTGASILLAEVATNRVHGLAAARDGDLLLLGDVRGNDVRVPHPVLIAIGPAQPHATDAAVARPAAHVSSLAAAPAAHSPAPAQRAPGSNTPVYTPASTSTHQLDRYDPVRFAACGSRKDYALDPKPIASGGQATVFGATHKATGTRVAFKRLNFHSADDLARMRREVEAARLFGDHPNVVPVLDFSSTWDWFVMPLVNDTAQTLAAKLRTERVLRDLIIAVCDALREPHRLGWIHRDLKPDNILSLDGRWAVADWGLGRRPRGQTTDPRRTQVGGAFGTEGFAAPELSVNAHTVGPQADIYSIGQIIGWALTGRWPQANVPLVPPAGSWRIIAKAATDPDSARRPATVDDLLALIASELDEPPKIPANRGEQLLAVLRSGDTGALGELVDLGARYAGDYDLYLQVLVDLNDDQTRAAVTANPAAVREIVRGVLHLHSDAGVTLEYGDVDRLVTWLLVIAYQAETVSEWDLLEVTAESIFYLDHWDRWNVQADIQSWLASRTGHAASVVAAALRRNPEIFAHFKSLTTDRRVDHRIRDALGGSL